MNENWYNILIIDDHPIVTDGLEKLLCAHTHAHCTKANNLETLTEILTRADFDLCITDLEFPGTDGFNLIRMIHKYLPQCPTLVYTMHDEFWLATQLCESDIREFINGAISKHASLNEIQQAVDAIRNGHEYFSQAFSLLNKKRFQTGNNSYRTLSKREKEVLAYLMQGNTDDSDVHPLQPIHGNGNTGDEYRKQMLVTLADELSNPDIQKEKDSAFTKYGKPAYYMNFTYGIIHFFFIQNNEGVEEFLEAKELI